jgi:thioredoxin
MEGKRMESEIVRCQKCGSLNRISRDRLQRGKSPVCGHCHGELGGSPSTAVNVPLKITDDNFQSLIDGASRPVFVDFWAGWCGPCLMIGPFIEELAADLAGRVDVGKLNVDENPRTAAMFGVRSIPTMIIFDQGREVGRISGAIPKEAMVEKIRTLGLL